MTEKSTNLTLPYLQASQAQKHITHNAALERLDLTVQLVLQSFSQTTPPLSPGEGQVWAVGSGAVNDWGGHDGELAAWSNGGWLFLVPRAGWRAVMGQTLRIWSGTGWDAPTQADLQNLSGVGINTSYDSTNKLAVKADATLLDNVGNGHQLKLNKVAAGDTASLLFQTGYSGRAEMGTLGNEVFAVKVSADGTAWNTALSVDAASNVTTLNQLGLSNALAPTSGGTGIANPAGATLTRSGAHALSLTTTADSSLTLPISGTLATLMGTETLSNKTLSAPVINTGVTGTAVVQSTGDTTAGRLLTTGAGPAQAFRRGNILGTVAQSAGAPTGAVIERGSNANGSYVRFADGTQICTRIITHDFSITTVQTFSFAASFSDSYPAASFCLQGTSGTSEASALYSGGFFLMAAGNGSQNWFTRSPLTTTAITRDMTVMAVGRWF